MHRRVERHDAVLVGQPAAGKSDVVAQRRQDLLAPLVVVAHNVEQNVLEHQSEQWLLQNQYTGTMGLYDVETDVLRVERWKWFISNNGQSTPEARRTNVLPKLTFEKLQQIVDVLFDFAPVGSKLD